MRSRYQLKERLGSGSSATVYRAVDSQTGEDVAVKCIRSVAPEALASAIEELSLLRLSSGSPHCLALQNHFIHDSEIWMILELCEPGSLAEFLMLPETLSDFVCLDEAMIAYVLHSVLQALAFLHDHSRIHRDVKASNILLTRSGLVKLGDLGVAAALTKAQPVRNTFTGSPLWMAPEVITKSGHAEPADIWSLGITAIEIAQRYPPWSDEHPLRALFLIPQEPPPRLASSPVWSANFCDFVASCLQKDPAQRPTAGSLISHAFFEVVKSNEVELQASLSSIIDRAMPLISSRRSPNQQSNTVTEASLTGGESLSKGQPAQRSDSSSEESSSNSVVYVSEGELEPSPKEQANGHAYQQYVLDMEKAHDRTSKQGSEGGFARLENSAIFDISLAELDSRIEFLAFREREEIERVKRWFEADRRVLTQERNRRKP